MVMGAVCANVDAAAAERPSATMKGREAAQDGTRREIGIVVTSRRFGGSWDFLRVTNYTFGRGQMSLLGGTPSWGSSLSATVVWFPESFLRVCLLPGFRALLVSILVLSSAACGAAQVGSGIQAAPVPDEMRDSFFAVTVNNQRVDVAHAASNYEFVSFDATGPVDISITAADPHFWDRGVDIEPWRLGLRASHPEGEPQTIRFRVTGPVKLSISRPGDFLNQARMLFLFADSPPPPPPSGPNVTIVPAGVHRESLNPKSGDTIYLEPGAFVFGSLNLWQVDNVKVLGRGTIVYDGPQDPNSDDGLDAEARLALHCELPGAQRGDRRADLHHSLAHLVDPDEGFDWIQV